MSGGTVPLPQVLAVAVGAASQALYRTAVAASR
jgi:hypothetical protein